MVEWVLVPVEATPEMVEACEAAMATWRKSLSADEAILRSEFRDGRRYIGTATPEEKHRIRWAAMLAARPAIDLESLKTFLGDV